MVKSILFALLLIALPPQLPLSPGAWTVHPHILIVVFGDTKILKQKETPPSLIIKGKKHDYHLQAISDIKGRNATIYVSRKPLIPDLTVPDDIWQEFRLFRSWLTSGDSDGKEINDKLNLIGINLHSTGV